MTRILIFLIVLTTASQAQTIRVGAKHFNEGYILSEIISQLLESNGYTVERKYNLGGTLVCFEALRNNAIDVYPEYSGTISSEILKQKVEGRSEINQLLNVQFKMNISNSFGFNNTYALVIKKELADSLGIVSISDLRNKTDLNLGLSYEFLKRQDGWDNLNTVYDLNLLPTGLEHGLAYQALDQGKIDITDAYSTDGEILKYKLAILADNKDFFPRYEAVALYNNSLEAKVKRIIDSLSNSITEQQMQAMNASVLYEKKTFEMVASEFLEKHGLAQNQKSKSTNLLSDLIAKTTRHLFLTFFALGLAVLFSVPLAVLIYWNPRLSKTVLYITALFQTIPSIALLAILIPFMGIGVAPAIVALFLYAVLPILRNTLTGLQSVDPLLKKVADGIGMSRFQKLRWVEFPLAIPMTMAGIRTAAVINVGTATLAAFIGAGGLGEFIVTGLALNNSELILRGAVPAALLALSVEIGFSQLEKQFVLKHLR
jgi:osmoprotectant transport system permease protein